MVTKKEIYDWGISHAQGIPENNWRDAIEKAVERGYDWDEDCDRIVELYNEYCYESEDNSRSYSPFEFTAKAINDLDDSKPYDPWEIFNTAISQYIDRYWNEHEEEIKAYFLELVEENN